MKGIVAQNDFKNNIIYILTIVHPEGFEPPTTVPKTGMISISPRVRRVDSSTHYGKIKMRTRMKL